MEFHDTDGAQYVAFDVRTFVAPAARGKYSMDSSDKSRQEPEPVVIPFHQLSPAALRGLIEYFVLREGTEYGAKEVPLHVKHDQVLRLLQEGAARIVFNPDLDSTDIEMVPVARRRNG